jgi:hypothetical protein
MTPGYHIRFFNCPANRARLAFQECPLEWDSRIGLCDEVHLVVGALGPFEKALLVHAAHVGHFRNGSKVRVHLVSGCAKADEAALLKEYPGFRQCAELDAINTQQADDFVESVVSIAAGWGRTSLMTVIPGGAAEAALTDALLLGERLKAGPFVRVLLDAPCDSGIRRMVARNQALSSWIHFMPGLPAAVGREAVFQEGLDAVARRIHETWKRGTDERIREAEAKGDLDTAAKHRAKDTYRDWEDLTEEQKDANRLAADHIAVKFRAVGLVPESGPSIRGAWSGLGATELDILSRMEHERWAAPLWMAGWTVGEQRNDELRIHPNLVPYDDLDEGTREYDLEQVKMAASYRFGS